MHLEGTSARDRCSVVDVVCSRLKCSRASCCVRDSGHIMFPFSVSILRWCEMCSDVRWHGHLSAPSCESLPFCLYVGVPRLPVCATERSARELTGRVQRCSCAMRSMLSSSDVEMDVSARECASPLDDMLLLFSEMHCSISRCIRKWMSLSVSLSGVLEVTAPRRYNLRKGKFMCLVARGGRVRARASGRIACSLHNARATRVGCRTRFP